MSGFENVDYFTELGLVSDPHPYFSYLRSQGPVTRLPHRNVVAVTGLEEGFAVELDHDNFSSINSATGPLPPLPFEPSGTDISEQLAAHRPEMPYGSMLVAMDPPDHLRVRRLLLGLLTAKRFKENEEHMHGLADRLIDSFINREGIEVISDYSHPFATLAIADLMGVPEEDHADILSVIGSLPGQIGGDAPPENNPLVQIGMKFYGYIEERRRTNRDDVMSRLANATYPDGTLPALVDIVGLAALLFGAGQDTTVRLIAAMIKTLCELPDIQDQLATNPSQIPDFVEEVLRLDGPTKAHFRLAKRKAKVGEIEVEPGTTVMLIPPAMNRDPRRFDEPDTFRLGRKNVRDHMSFGRGVHTCIGAQLARAEARLSLEKLLRRVKNIRLNEDNHGPVGARKYDYELNYTQRALRSIHVLFDRV